MNDAWSEQKQNDRRKLTFRQCFRIGNQPENTRRCCTGKYKKGPESWLESFQRIEKTYPRSTFDQFQNMSLAITDFINLLKQTQPPSRSSPGHGRKEHHRVHLQKYQVLFNEAPPQVFKRMSLCQKKTSNFHHIPGLQIDPSRTNRSIFISNENDNFD